MASYITKKKKELEVLKTRTPSVLVVLGYYNGEKYIDEQLESLEKQIGVQVNVQIFDASKKNILRVSIPPLSFWSKPPASIRYENLTTR